MNTEASMVGVNDQDLHFQLKSLFEKIDTIRDEIKDLKSDIEVHKIEVKRQFKEFKP